MVFSCGWGWHGGRGDQGRLAAGILQAPSGVWTKPLFAFFLVGLPRWRGVSAKQHSWDTSAHPQGQGNTRTGKQSRGAYCSDRAAITDRVNLITIAQFLQMIRHHLLNPTGKMNSGIWEENDSSVRYGRESHKQGADSQVNGEGHPRPQALCLEGREVRTRIQHGGPREGRSQGRHSDVTEQRRKWHTHW